MEFHISRRARRRYQFEKSLFTFNGSVIFANFHAARVFAQRMNEQRDLVSHPELAIRCGQINAMGLIDEILHYIIFLYRAQKSPSLYQDLEIYLEQQVGRRRLNAALRAFIREFPPAAVYQGRMSVDEYLAGENDGIANKASTLEEMLMLWLTNRNPACDPYKELFSDEKLADTSAYLPIIVSMQAFFENQPPFGPDSQNLVDMLRSPAIAVPHSLQGQLEYIRSRWSDLLGHYLLKLLGSLTMLLEEERPRGLGPGPVRIPVYAGAEGWDEERFSPDADWMPRLVLMAKNTYVWLDQLSKRYQRAITRLDQIPDEELERLAEWGFTGLWLIGLWERSRASARIKQLCGNPEAIASAYSLREYRIAEDLGGEAALEDLRRRAWRKGLRLASDMVPNHMAIDSDWLYDHPDWFLSAPNSPFPAYSFNGPNLSEDERGEIYIEDHYYNQSDAAVVFKYHDRRTGQTHYIYHGNDGTSMPWNDTAQLNYLNPQVREAVIQTILDVARRFPIIRFDAAMTLTKRHFQRLWFPLPGGGCDIPSRSDFALSAEQFNQLMPQEFWREVVDRAASEAPDTLLLAEAFWLMEGYFVRTLGMHRVYNSAFMNLLRDEENAKYRQVMKNTLEFDPEILRRFVNFMNNPDEHTAATQFGKGDKYFGICTMLATLPGLPMFGHGQVEGLTEKYGMEYKRAYWDEQPDQQLIERHYWQIFPLLKRRYLFSGVEHFYLYDFYTHDGLVDENVFAYSNRVDDERSLVIFYNRFGDTSGWVRVSSAFMDKTQGVLRQVDLSGGLNIPGGKDQYVVFRDQLTGMEYIRSCMEIAQKGLFIQLDAYKSHVFVDFQIVQDDEEHIWRQVHDHLAGRGSPDLQTLRWELPLWPVLKPLREIANPGYFDFLLHARPQAAFEQPPEFLLNEADHKLHNLLIGAAVLQGISNNFPEICKAFRDKLTSVFQAVWLDQLLPELNDDNPAQEMMEWLREKITDEKWLSAICWIYLDCLQSALRMNTDEFFLLAEKWRLFAVIESAVWEIPTAHISAGDFTRSIQLLMLTQGWHNRINRRNPNAIWRSFVADHSIGEYLTINEYGGRTWFGKESAESFITLLALNALVEITSGRRQSRSRVAGRVRRLSAWIQTVRAAADWSGYDLEQFLARLSQAEN